MIKNIDKLYSFLKKNNFINEANLLKKVSQEERVHKVVSNDNLSSIALKYDVPQAKIEKLNNLTADSVLQIGQVIKLPEANVYFNSVQSPSDNLIEWMKYEEGGNGSRPKGYKCDLPVPGRGEPYLCSYDDGRGNLTIGWGRNQNRQEHQVIEDYDYLEKLLIEDIDEAADHLKSSIEGIDETKLTIPVSLNQGQFDALTSLIFNSGRSAFKGSSLYENYISKGKIGPQFSSEISTEFKSYRVGKDQAGLVGRRERELAMFLRGEYNKK